MKTYTDGVKEVAEIIHRRGDDGDLAACLELVEETRLEGNAIMETGADYSSLQDLLQDNLDLEPDYIMTLWL